MAPPFDTYQWKGPVCWSRKFGGRYSTKKILEISPADTQGLENNMTGLGELAGLVGKLFGGGADGISVSPKKCGLFPSDF